MKDNKNVVFALNSFTTEEPLNFSNHGKGKDIVFIEQGFLLFPNEERADAFLELCEIMNKVKKTNNYTKFSYVEVSDFVAGKVDTQHNFYVSSSNAFTRVISPEDEIFNVKTVIDLEPEVNSEDEEVVATSKKNKK